MTPFNLLPDRLKQGVRIERLRIAVLEFGVFFIMGLSILGVALFLIKFYMQARLLLETNALKIQQLDPALSSFFAVRKELEDVNNGASFIVRFQDRLTDLPKLFEALFPLIPSEIKLNSVSFAASSRKINISGRAPTRESFLEFKSRVENSSLVSEVESPLGNILHPKDISFTITVKLR